MILDENIWKKYKNTDECKFKNTILNLNSKSVTILKKDLVEKLKSFKNKLDINDIYITNLYVKNNERQKKIGNFLQSINQNYKYEEVVLEKITKNYVLHFLFERGHKIHCVCNVYDINDLEIFKTVDITCKEDFKKVKKYVLRSLYTYKDVINIIEDNNFEKSKKISSNILDNFNKVFGKNKYIKFHKVTFDNESTIYPELRLTFREKCYIFNIVFRGYEVSYTRYKVVNDRIVDYKYFSDYTLKDISFYLK